MEGFLTLTRGLGVGSAWGRRHFRPRVMWQLLAAVFVLLWLVLPATWGTCQTSGPTVITEPRTTLFPAGPGRTPFDVTRHTIPFSEIRGGGPPRDGIPALVQPNFLRAHEVGRLLKDSDRVLGVFWNSEAKAYPVRILNWHELINDSVGSRSILVSW